ncbi:MAG: ribulose-phosphate 3-epimerase [Actinomycetes bacterium]|jgi:ribulose-phosphate 3-epimerase|nr:ribulose-phosphate 3-epimerase [Actinomycetes bacterium]
MNRIEKIDAAATAGSVVIAPSLLSADFARLEQQIRLIEDAGADWLHLDVMDGHFVPNLTFGPPVIARLREITDLPLDAHLMINNPDETFDWYLEAGADLIVTHLETTTYPVDLAARAHLAGKRYGVSVKPYTPIITVSEIAPFVDVILVMSVEPGFSGQKFIETTPERIQLVKQMCEVQRARPIIQVDGGINAETVVPCARAGARAFVGGNAIYKAPDPAAAIADIRAAAERVK